MLEFLLNKVAGLKVRNSTKKRLQPIDFPVNIVKFLRTPFLKNVYFCTFQTTESYSAPSP